MSVKFKSNNHLDLKNKRIEPSHKKTEGIKYVKIFDFKWRYGGGNGVVQMQQGNVCETSREFPFGRLYVLKTCLALTLDPPHDQPWLWSIAQQPDAVQLTHYLFEGSQKQM